MTVVDYDRLRRLQLPDDPEGLSGLTKFYIVIIFLFVIFLIKRYKDRQKRETLLETF